MHTMFSGRCKITNSRCSTAELNCYSVKRQNHLKTTVYNAWEPTPHLNDFLLPEVMFQCKHKSVRLSEAVAFEQAQSSTGRLTELLRFGDPIGSTLESERQTGTELLQPGTVPQNLLFAISLLFVLLSSLGLMQFVQRKQLS